MGPISLFFGLVILVIFFGIVLLVAGTIWLLVYVRLRHRRRARSAVVIAGLVLVFAFIGWFLASLLVGLGLIPVSERSMVGTYVVHYRTDDGRPAGTDTLTLKPDHTFIQICLPEKGKQIEAVRVGPGPIKKYNRVRMVGTWHRDCGNHLTIEGALSRPRTGFVAGNPYVRAAPSISTMSIEWHIGGPAILAAGDPDSGSAVYFRKVK